MDSPPIVCPLCLHALDPLGAEIRGVLPARRYRLCEACLLVFVDCSEHPSPEEERARYELHRNCLEDAGYVAFLRRLVDPTIERLRRHEGPRTEYERPPRILDYGCGPATTGEPVLARLVRNAGLPCEWYDPYFFPTPPEGLYDIVFASEVIEHFRQPREDIERLLDRLAPGGLLSLMTERWTRIDAFPRWSYTSDPTHLAFYHERTLAWIAARFSLEEAYRDDARVWIARRG